MASQLIASNSSEFSSLPTPPQELVVDGRTKLRLFNLADFPSIYAVIAANRQWLGQSFDWGGGLH